MKSLFNIITFLSIFVIAFAEHGVDATENALNSSLEYLPSNEETTNFDGSNSHVFVIFGASVSSFNFLIQSFFFSSKLFICREIWRKKRFIQHYGHYSAIICFRIKPSSMDMLEAT